MKVLFSKIREADINGVVFEERTLTFEAARPTIVQPSEIMKVPINATIKVQGEVVLNISTHPDLSQKAGELFPGLIAVDENSGELVLELPVRNGGRNPINLRMHDRVAVGHLIPTTKIEPEEYFIDLAPAERPQSTPQKRNDGFKFEVR